MFLSDSWTVTIDWYSRKYVSIYLVNHDMLETYILLAAIYNFKMVSWIQSIMYNY